MNFLIFGSIAYLLGSIPSAVWIGRSWYGIDVREHGSKNSGATNTFRILGKNAGVFVLIIDVFKGLLAILLPSILSHSIFTGKLVLEGENLIHVQLVAAIFAVIGHVLPVFARFKGGKGVATSLGVIIGIHPSTAAICLLVFLLVFLITNYVSFGAICASITFPICLSLLFKVTDFWFLLFSVFLAFAVIFAHRKNIIRLLKGEESKMNLLKK
jgi:acyl phosphate:glycerol-3-phosphate acyltransferase